MRQYFSDEEWSTLLKAPMDAVMAICLADNVDPISFLQELKAGVTIVGEELKRLDVAGDLAPALIASLSEIDSQEPLSGEQLILKKQFEMLGLMQTFKKAKEARDYAVGNFQKVATILETKVTGAQATDFKTWLMSIAQKVAEVQREGGVMGIGSSRISERERDVLNKLAEALGLPV
ncbi:MAG TPA: hypothetical protein IGR64_09715 [Leptolyngbyaceae cyanobacterium M65_K2018_010]|nr:hypothetical protein [Leptolyngbyaceae cyanobacterium M65_K2018_010]